MSSQNQLREDMVVLIDQGVRTWGDVRLLLSAAALAFGEKAARKGIEFALAGTSNGGALVNPASADVETVAALVEASDLSENPADALECVLEAKGSGTISPKGGEIEPDPARDIVILAHTRVHSRATSSWPRAARRRTRACSPSPSTAKATSKSTNSATVRP